MKKKLLVIILILSCCCISKNAKAQWVTIPDTGFVYWLNLHGFGSCMNGNQMDTTCGTIVTYTSLNFSAWYIKDYTGLQYFDNLNLLNISGTNQINYLPPLPISLQYLIAYNCNLTNPIALPPALTDLELNHNNLTSLGTLPNNLKFLDCSENNLSTLPPLPNSLNYLHCEFNNLTSLPILTPNIKWLSCSYNSLTILPILSPQMQELSCNNNFLTIIPILPSTLKYLNCSFNYISNLPDLPKNMHTLNVSGNANLHCLPALKQITYLDFSNAGVTCLPNYGTVTNSNPSLSTIPLCDLYNNNGCKSYWNISGNVYSDINSNCISETLEPKNANLKLVLFDTLGNLLQQTFTGSEGLYSFDTDTGTYTYSVDTTNLPILVSCPVTGYQSSILTALDSMDYAMDFGIQCKPGFDVGINGIVRDSGSFRPANFATVSINAGDMTNKYGLHCASGINGIVTVIINGPATFIAAANGALIPIVNGDTITYTIADFGTVNFNSDFKIIVQTDTTAIIGNSICFDVNVTPTSGDIYLSNNSLQHCFNVINSFDPNEKEVYPINRIDNKNGKLSYTIHFQNTGNAAAQHIYILDTLDAAIDESSFELLAYSFQPQLQIVGNVVRFNFPSINLPDSLNDEPNSHGYVQYGVKLKDSLALGTVISNTSYIYFDFNAPVQTNTVVDTLNDCYNLAAIDIINQTFCAGDTLKINAALTYPATINWYVDSLFISSNQNIAIPNLSTGNHEIKLVAINAYCNTEVISNVVIHSLPLVDLGNDSVTCNLPVILNSGVNNASYLWSNGKSTKKITVKNTGTFSVIVTNVNGCSNTDTINVTLHALPAINIGIDTSTCSVPLPLDAGSGNVSYLWSNGATTQTIIANVSANYSVVVVDSNGCSNADTINVFINPLPAKPVISQSISLLTSSSNTGNQWLLNDSIISGANNNTYTVTLTGWYAVQVTDSNGCRNKSDSIYMDLTGLNDVINSRDEIRIIPNPATTAFEIIGKNFQVNDVVTITDVIGKVVYQTKILQPTSSLKVEAINYLSGIYFVNIKTSSQIFTLKLVKQ